LRFADFEQHVDEAFGPIVKRYGCVNTGSNTFSTECEPAAVRACLAGLAQLLDRYAGDALKGDFGIFPRLQARADRQAKKPDDGQIGGKNEGSS